MSAAKYVKAFVDTIPNAKLEGSTRERNKVYFDVNMRLDCQETIKHPCELWAYNLQVQINKGCELRSLAKAAPDTFACIVAPVHEPWSAAKIGEELKRSVTGWPIREAGNKLE